MIKHIVIPGGGPTGFVDYGIIEYICQNGYVELDNIQSIHATSVGAFIGLTMCLKDNWEIYRDYMINCHYDKIFYIDPNKIINILSHNNIMSDDCFIKYVSPVLLANNLDVDITLKQFYEFSKIDFYLYTTRESDLSSIALSHYNYPDMKLIDAINASGAIPFIFKPIAYKDELFIDGGIFANTPLRECLESKEDINPEEVLAIVHDYNKAAQNDVINYNLFDFAMHLLWKLLSIVVKKIANAKDNKEIDEKMKNVNIIHVDFNQTSQSASDLFNVFSDKQMRENLVQKGTEIGENFINDQKKED